MHILKTIAVSMIAVSVGATSAFAAPPVRSAHAVPAAYTAPVSGVRVATPLKHRSAQSDGSSPALGYALAAVVGAGIIAAVIAGTDNDSHSRPSSAG